MPMAEKAVYIIAEIGTAHNGDLATAKRLVDAAAQAGADCAKFQTVFADEIVPPNVGEVPLPGGSIPLYDRFRSLEQPIEFYAALLEHCKSRDIDFLSTPFGLESARLLRSINVQCIKIASPELNHLPLLSEVAGYRLPLILSTGVSRLEDIERAVETCREVNPSIDLCLLHCVTSYPAPPEDYNLHVMSGLKTIFGVDVGVSDHSLDPRLVPLLSTTLGVTTIEKHICLSRSGDGLDDPIALDPAAFAVMVDAVRWAEETELGQVIEYCCREFGESVVQKTLGNGHKQLSDSERSNYGRTNRSIHAICDLPAGHTIGKDDYRLLRTEKVLRPGLPPHLADVVEGATLRRAVPAGEGICWNDLID